MSQSRTKLKEVNKQPNIKGFIMTPNAKTISDQGQTSGSNKRKKESPPSIDIISKEKKKLLNELLDPLTNSERALEVNNKISEHDQIKDNM